IVRVVRDDELISRALVIDRDRRGRIRSNAFGARRPELGERRDAGATRAKGGRRVRDSDASVQTTETATIVAEPFVPDVSPTLVNNMHASETVDCSARNACTGKVRT